MQVPGLGYIDFLHEVLDFLASHPKEIVFYEVRCPRSVHECDAHLVIRSKAMVCRGVSLKG